MNPNFIISEIADETVLINQTTEQRDFAHLLTLNSSAKLLFEKLSGKEFTQDDASNVLREAYGISEEKAWTGAKIWVKLMEEYKVIE